MRTFKHRLLLAGMASFTTFGLVGCHGKLDYRNSQVVNGALYARGANEPFTGPATNIPNPLVLDRPEFMTFSDTTVQALVTSLTLASPPTSRDAIINRLGGVIRQASLGGFPSDADDVTVFCDVPVTDGVPDGKVQCKSAQLESVVLEATFAGGKLEGQLTSYTIDGGKQNPLVTATFRNGQPEGKEEIYSPNTHRVVHTLNWSNGSLSGVEEVFDENNDKTLEQVSYVDNKREGDFSLWAPGGKQIIDKGTYVNGALDGLEEGFDPDTGRKTAEAHWSNGKLNGELKKWDAQGNLIALKTYQNGFLATTSDEQETRFAYGQDPQHPAVYVPLSAAPVVGTDTAVSAPAAATPASTPAAAEQPIPQAASTINASAASNAGPVIKRCGWIENNLPSSLTLKDRDGTWDMTGADGIDSAPATEKGESCGCLTVVSDKASMRILRVSGGKLSPLSACQKDATLN